MTRADLYETLSEMAGSYRQLVNYASRANEILSEHKRNPLFSTAFIADKERQAERIDALAHRLVDDRDLPELAE